MENQLIDGQSVDSMHGTHHKKEIGLSLVALCLSLVPFLLVFLSNIFNFNLPGLVILFIILSPIAGLIMGIASLCKGKKKIGNFGMIFSIIAIALPALLIILIILLFIGAATGVISFM